MNRNSLALVLPALLLAACGTGSVSVTGDLGGYTFAPKTTYGWIAETVMKDATYKPADHKTLNIVMSGASFDPTDDARFTSVDDRLEETLDAAKNGTVSFRIRNFEKAAVATALASPQSANAPADSSQLEIRSFDFAEQELASDAAYPAAPVMLGSKITFTVTFDTLGAKEGETSSGKLVVTVEKGDHDLATVKTGTMTFEFSAPLVSEVIAGCRSNPASCDPNSPVSGD
jgi:hypothetical protein